MGSGRSSESVALRALRRRRRASISSIRVSFTRGRPADSPSARSWRSIAAQPVVGDELGLAVAQQRARPRRRRARRERVQSRAGLTPRSAGERRRSIASTVSWASFLFVPITPEGPRLIQPTTYSPGSGVAGRGVEHAAPVVGDHAAALVEGNAGQRDAAVADRAEDETRRDRLALLGRLGAQAAARQPATSSLRTSSTAPRRPCSSGMKADGREQEAQHDRAWRGPRGGARVGAQDLDVAPRGDVGLGARVVDRERAVELRRIDDHVGVGELAELAAAPGS